jgi:hypothetical protein
LIFLDALANVTQGIAHFQLNTGGEVYGLEHCHGMLDKILESVSEKRIEKAFRWLGFVQGVLWTSRVYPLTDLKNHNRPPEEGSNQ